MKQLLFILFLFISFATRAQMHIGADGAGHSNNTDLPFALSNEIKGAPKRVNSIAERNAIPPALRDTGMTCYVTAIDSTYILRGGILNQHWQLFTTSGGGGISGSGSALTMTYVANGYNQIIPVYTGQNTVASVQTLTDNGTGIQRWLQMGDSTYIFYGDPPEDTIKYILAVVGNLHVDTTIAGGGSNPGGGTGGGGNNNGGGTPPTPPTPPVSGNSAWAFTTDTGCQVKYGALFALGSTSANMIALANTGLSYARVPYNGSGTVNYPAYTAGGYNVLLSLNPAPPSTGNYTPLPTDTLAYRNGIKNLLAANGTTNLIGAALINEWNNIKHGQGYWNPVSAQNVINLLHAGANALHESGLKAYDGGFTGEILYYEVWKDYVNRGFTDSAADFAGRAFPAGANLNTWATDTAHGYRITFLDSVIAALPSLPLDGVNFHYYETLLDKDSLTASINALTFKQIARYLHRVSGKPVITNEFGTNNNTNPDILSQLIDAVEELHDAQNGDMSMAFWYAGDASHPIANADGSLTDFGIALRDKIRDTRVDITGGQLQ